jgi:signal transduction histidine kinase
MITKPSDKNHVDRLRILEQENAELKELLAQLRGNPNTQMPSALGHPIQRVHELAQIIDQQYRLAGAGRCAAPPLPKIHISGHIHAGHNKTEQEQQLVQLQREHVALKAIIENAPEGIVVVDENGCITMTNPAADRLYARPVPYRKSRHSHHLLQLRNSDGRVIGVDEMPLSRSALHGEVIMDREMAIEWPDGQTRRLLVNSAPIRDDQGKIRGAVGVFQDITRRIAERDRLEDSRKELERLVTQRTVALQATVRALESKIYERELIERGLRRTQAELEQLSRSALSALEADRQSVSKELHDSIGASLAFIKFGLEEQLNRMQHQQVPSDVELAKIIHHLIDAIKETKRIAGQLRPLTLDDLGVIATIHSFCRNTACLNMSTEISAHIEVAEEEVADDYKIIIYRVMQEAVANAVRHGKAKNIRIHLAKGVEGVEFSVQDDGSGFEQRSIGAKKDPLSGHGIESMRARARICGGRFNIVSKTGQGTRVGLMLPWRSPG